MVCYAQTVCSRFSPLEVSVGLQCSPAPPGGWAPETEQINHPNAADSPKMPVFLHSLPPPFPVVPLLFISLSGWTLTFPSLPINMLLIPLPPLSTCTISRGVFVKVGGPCGAMPLEESKWGRDKMMSRNVFSFFSLLHPSFLNCLMTFVVLPPGCVL